MANVVEMKERILTCNQILTSYETSVKLANQRRVSLHSKGINI